MPNNQTPPSLGHTYVFRMMAGISNISYTYPDLIERWTFQFIMNGIFAVDSFFYLSGFLIGFFLLKELKEKGIKGINWAVFYGNSPSNICPSRAYCNRLTLLFYTQTGWIHSKIQLQPSR